MLCAIAMPAAVVRLARAHSTLSSSRQLRLSEATSSDWAAIVSTLAPFAKEERVAKLNDVLGRRRAGIHVVLENVEDAFNTAAVLRTAEGLGVQHVHLIKGKGSRSPRRHALQNVNMGASRWLSVEDHRCPVECYQRLRALGLFVVASDCTPAGGLSTSGLATDAPRGAEARPLHSLDFESGRGVALVFGNERKGVSRACLENADGRFHLPMSGLTQSFNISVACAMAMYAAIATGRFPEGSLTDDERTELLGRWLLRDVKASRPLLQRAGIAVLPD